MRQKKAMIDIRNPYTILFLHHTGRFSGAENSLLHLATHLDSKMFLPVFICPKEGEFPSRLKQKGIPIIPHNFGRIREIRRLFNSIRVIRKAMFRYNATIIHSNGPQSNIPAGVAGRLLRIPVIWHARNLLQTEMVDIDRVAAFLPQRIVCNSDAIRARFIGSRSEKIALTVINSVDLKDYDPSIPGKMIKEEFGFPPGSQVLGIVGRLSPEKGHLTVFEAMAHLRTRFPDLRLLVVGGHIFEEHSWFPNLLKRKASQLNIAERVVFTGFRRDVLRLYAGMDIFVLGTDAEPCGRVIFEAMAMKKPVIGTNNGGTPEIVVDGETGLLYRYGNAQELADKIAFVLNNPLSIEKMGRAGRKRVEENFTINKYVDKMQEIYLSLIEANPWE